MLNKTKGKAAKKSGSKASVKFPGQHVAKSFTMSKYTENPFRRI